SDLLTPWKLGSLGCDGASDSLMTGLPRWFPRPGWPGVPGWLGLLGWSGPCAPKAPTASAIDSAAMLATVMVSRVRLGINMRAVLLCRVLITKRARRLEVRKHGSAANDASCGHMYERRAPRGFADAPVRCERTG